MILVGSNQATSEFFGRGVSMSLDATSVAASLDTIDRWCRLHLPQAFLEEYQRGLDTVPGQPGVRALQ